MTPRTIHVISTAILALSGLLGLLLAADIAIETDGHPLWVVGLVGPPMVVFVPLVATGLAYKRARRRRLVRGAEAAGDRSEIERVLEEIRRVEDELGRLRLEPVVASLERKLDQGGRPA